MTTIDEANKKLIDLAEKPEGTREFERKITLFYPLAQLVRIALEVSGKAPLFDYDASSNTVCCSWLGCASRAPVVPSRLREKQDPVFLAHDASAMAQARRTALLGLMVCLPDPDSFRAQSRQDQQQDQQQDQARREKPRPPIDAPHCKVCGDHLPEKVATFSMRRFQTHLCLTHQKDPNHAG